MSFQYKNYIISLDRLSGEVDNIYYDKGYIIAKGRPNDTQEYNALLKTANITTSIKHTRCSYSKNVEKLALSL